MNATFKLIIAMTIWGSIGLFVKHLAMPSITIAFWRAFIASLFLGFAGFKSIRKQISHLSRKNLFFLILSGAAMGFNWVLLFQSYRFTTISNATLSYYFAPMFVLLFSPIILHEKLDTAKFISVIGCILGLFIILLNSTSETSQNYHHLTGVLFGLSAASLYASVVILNKYIQNVPGYLRTFMQISISALVLLPMNLTPTVISSITGTNLLLLLLVGIVHTGVAYLLYFSSIEKLKAQNVAVLSYIDPISAVLFGVFFLAEPFSIAELCGGLLILLSTFLGQRRS